MSFRREQTNNFLINIKQINKKKFMVYLLLNMMRVIIFSYPYYRYIVNTYEEMVKENYSQ